MTELELWKYAKSVIDNGSPLMMTVVLDARESTPGKQGFKMVTGLNGEINGSVGGGKMEYDVIQESVESLKAGAGKNYFKYYNHYGDKPGSTGMICSGSQIIGYLRLGKDDAETVAKVVNAIEKNTGGIFSADANGIGFSELNGRTKKFGFDEEEWAYSEVIGIKERVYIFGGGHVGLSVSEIMSFLDFHVIVIEKRKDIFTLINNCHANEIINEDFVDYSDKIIEDDFSYVIIVTPSHFHDEDVLRAVIGKKVRYIGMMGSKAKVKSIFRNMKNDGITEEMLDGIHSPIGLPIGSKTPDEIAVSIAAEIIKIKNSVFF
ncbi:MAG: XdhC family protein [Bacteroidetes bacterium]|nr:XdhC family protein [Bacteroidota bacterium]